VQLGGLDKGNVYRLAGSAHRFNKKTKSAKCGSGGCSYPLRGANQATGMADTGNQFSQQPARAHMANDALPRFPDYPEEISSQGALLAGTIPG